LLHWPTGRARRGGTLADHEITRLLGIAAQGDAAAFEQVAAWAYTELERLAASRMRRRYGGRLDGLTLEPAALVNETFLRLLEKPIGFENRRHFLAFASRLMLGALADYERRRRAQKRGGDRLRVTLTGLADDVRSPDVALSDLEAAFEELEALDARKAEIVKLRVLWGASNEDAARLLEISESTVERDWRFSRMWLGERLGIVA
jgi:RNA polymerase sigma factor (TIGR02999 family)